MESFVDVLGASETPVLAVPNRSASRPFCVR